jgi:dihydrofolate reductase
MGRKTWESIPPRFQPLKDRVNIVVTRNPASLDKYQGKCTVVDSLEASIEALKETDSAARAFVIGGAQIYKASLELKEAKRILLTRVLSDFDCDTFFPIELGEDGKTGEWVRASKEELDAWTGEEVPGGVQEENGTRYVFEMWERRD